MRTVTNLFERDEGQLSLDVGVLRQMASSVGTLRSVALCYTIYIAQRRNTRLQVELRGLGQVSLLPEVVKLEEGGSPFYLTLNHGGRRHLNVGPGKNMKFVFSFNNRDQTVATLGCHDVVC